MGECDSAPYNIDNFNSFTSYIQDVNYLNNTHSVGSESTVIDFDKWKKCIADKKLSKNVDKNLASINTILGGYNISEQTRTDTANELNKYSMTLYQNDIYYTYSKFFMFVVLIFSYIYFFRMNGIIEPIMKLFNIVNTQINGVVSKITEKKIPVQKPKVQKPIVQPTNAPKPKVQSTNAPKPKVQSTNSQKSNLQKNKTSSM